MRMPVAGDVDLGPAVTIQIDGIHGEKSVRLASGIGKLLGQHPLLPPIDIELVVMGDHHFLSFVSVEISNG